jgi:PAS domain S-box-containing protein
VKSTSNQNWNTEKGNILDRKSWKPDLKEIDNHYQTIFEAADDGLIISALATGQIVDVNPAACLMHGYKREEILGRELIELIHPDSRHGFSEYIGAFPINSKFDIRIRHIRLDGTTFFAEWHGTILMYESQPCLLGVVRDISERIRAEQLLDKNVRNRTHEQATLLEISHILASTLELQPDLILDQLRKIIAYTHAALFALEDSSLVTLAMRGTPELEQAPPFRIQIKGVETLVALFNEHQPIRIADIWSDDPQAQFLRSLLDDGAAALLEVMQSWMWVPLAVKGRIIGGIGIAETRKNYFTAHHADLALSVANQAAITMVNAELYGHAQALAVLEERQRLARNLHDAVNQSLFSAGLIAEVLPRLWDRDQAQARRSLEDLRLLTRGAQAEMRALLAELRPSTLTDSNLGDLIRLLGNAFTGRTNIPVDVHITGETSLPADVHITGETSLPADVQVALYRICQEALNNIAKHGKASQVEIHLVHEKQAGGMPQVTIRDNGRGFDPSLRPPSGHYGLGMMRERAEAVGAVVRITSQPGQGTEVFIHWPEKERL